MSLPNKRTASNATATAASNSNYSPMKKAKSQAVACSIDPSKNGLHHHPPQPDFTNPENDVVFDPSSMALDEDLKPDETRAPAAANLARKKAQPPQPAKKLVIKLVKGMAVGNCCVFNWRICDAVPFDYSRFSSRLGIVGFCVCFSEFAWSEESRVLLIECWRNLKIGFLCNYVLISVELELVI